MVLKRKNNIKDFVDVQAKNHKELDKLKDKLPATTIKSGALKPKNPRSN